MTKSAEPYVTQTAEGGWRVNGTRVSLDSIVHAYRNGAAPESILADFPSLSLEQIHGALAHYLRHRDEIDRWLVAQEARWEQLRRSSETDNADLLRRLQTTSPKSWVPCFRGPQ
jgi:uncharacterized protein (DUF433 family)